MKLGPLSTHRRDGSRPARAVSLALGKLYVTAHRYSRARYEPREYRGEVWLAVRYDHRAIGMSAERWTPLDLKHLSCDGRAQALRGCPREVRSREVPAHGQVRPRSPLERNPLPPDWRYTDMKDYGDISAWLATPPSQPRWRRLGRLDSIWPTDNGPVAHWRSSEWRLELSLRRARVTNFQPRRMLIYCAGREPLKHREIRYHGVRFQAKVYWDAR